MSLRPPPGLLAVRQHQGAYEVALVPVSRMDVASVEQRLLGDVTTRLLLPAARFLRVTKADKAVLRAGVADLAWRRRQQRSAEAAVLLPGSPGTLERSLHITLAMQNGERPEWRLFPDPWVLPFLHLYWAEEREDVRRHFRALAEVSAERAFIVMSVGLRLWGHTSGEVRRIEGMIEPLDLAPLFTHPRRSVRLRARDLLSSVKGAESP